MSTSRKRNSNKQGPFAAIFFLIWPFLTAAFAVKKFREPWAKNVIWAFAAFYGFALVIGAESQGSDITRYIEEYQFLHQQELDISGVINYFQNSGELDLLRTFIAVILSRFIDHPVALTTVYGIIFGYFFSRNMWFVMDRLSGKLKPFSIFLLVSLFLIIPIWNMNGFRMWTAAHIFIYGLFQYLIDGRRKGAWIALSSILVHYSFVVPVLTLFFYRLLGNRTSLFMLFFIGSFFFAEFDVQLISNIVIPYLPEYVFERTDGYISAERIIWYREAGIDENLNWYAAWYGRAMKWFICSLLVWVYFTGFEQIKKNKMMLILFSFVLFFYSIANFASNIPSGGRFISVINLAAVAFLIFYFQNYEVKKSTRIVGWAVSPAALLFIIVTIRTSLYFSGVTTVLGNPFVELFLLNEGVSLNDIMKSLI